MVRTSRMPVWFTCMIAVILGGATCATVWFLWREPHMLRNDYVARDVAQLADIFQRINQACSILGFDRTHNYINFLNVVLYKGSEIGPMHVRYPEEWDGPYATRNPSMQGIHYMVVRNQHGWYITPGEGVQLSDGSTVGTDIVVNYDTDIPSMLQEGGVLNHKGTPLARAITIDG